MKDSIFQTSDYKAFIKIQCETNRNVRGYHGLLADAAGCQRSYFSQMLHSDINLSAEQGLRLASLWHLTDDETDYFLELIQLARTTYPPLQKRIRSRLREIKARRENFSQRYSHSGSISDEGKQLYYSSWQWSAIHILAGISEFQDVPSISRRLSLNPEIVKDVLTKLALLGLIRQSGGRWQCVPGHVHLGKDSPFAIMNHSSWRWKAIEDAQHSSRDGLHYTVVQSHSAADFERLKDICLKLLDQRLELVNSSPNEEMSCLCLDIFRVF